MTTIITVIFGAEPVEFRSDTTIVLNHMGHVMALAMDDRGRAEAFQAWRLALREIARRSNVVCKIGGLGLPFWASDSKNASTVSVISNLRVMQAGFITGSTLQVEGGMVRALL
jgi:predicted TIM-barrel fold metal-dependent hydrolase